MRYRCTVRNAAALLGTAVLALALTACEPPSPDLLLGPAPETAPLIVLDHAKDETGALTVRFSRPLDPNSVGSRSVRLLSPRGRVGCRTHVAGDTLSVRPTSLRRRGRSSLVLRLEGEPSPRALRAADGTLLATRTEIAFAAEQRGGDDRTPPVLKTSSPQGGERDVAPGGAITLTFSEPLDRGAVRSGRAVTVTADDLRVPARLRLSADRSMLVIKPRSVLPAGSTVVVRVEPALTDLAGNPAQSGQSIRFGVRSASFLEVREEFVGQEMADLSGTSCSWCGPSSPGFLVWGSGRRALGPRVGADATLDLGDRERVHFQVVFPPDDSSEPSFASAVRIVLSGQDVLEGVRSATVEAGTTDVAAVEPTFDGNRLLARLLPYPVAHGEHALEVVPFAESFGIVEIPFDQPLPVPPGQSVLIDVELELAPGVRVIAVPDSFDQALVDGASGGLLLPAAQLLVSGGMPRARSHWYDTGVAQPRWRRASVVADRGDSGVEAVFEYQTAPPRRDGAPDLDRASPWAPDLADLPAHRFVRFRARFVGFPNPAALPRIDRLVMPYESR